MIVEFDGKVYDLSDREQRVDYAIAKWSPRIFNMANRYSNTICSVEDLVQEAKMKIVKASDLWDPNHDSGTEWATYAFAAIKNAILEASTRSMYAMSIPSGSLDSVVNIGDMKASRVSDEVADDRGDPNEFMELCDTLENFDHYRIGHMYFVEGRTLGEISKMIGMSRSTVGRNINKLKNLLKSRLGV